MLDERCHCVSDSTILFEVFHDLMLFSIVYHYSLVVVDKLIILKINRVSMRSSHLFIKQSKKILHYTNHNPTSAKENHLQQD